MGGELGQHPSLGRGEEVVPGVMGVEPAAQPLQPRRKGAEVGDAPEAPFDLIEQVRRPLTMTEVEFEVDEAGADHGEEQWGGLRQHQEGIG